MIKNKNIQIKPLVISILISLSVGILAGLLTMDSMEIYKSLNQPPLAPKGYVFPIVWSILFILMGISSYIIFTSPPTKNRTVSLIVYLAQLFFNFCWTLIFFNLKAYLFAFIWILILLVLIITMIYFFYKVDHLSVFLQIPYLLWVTFASYLNLMIYLLN